MQRYRAGDSGAFDRLYDRYRGPLFRYIKRLAGAEPAEELYQDVWLRMVRAREQWHADQPFSPWLYRIAHNRVVDHWRAQGIAVDDDKAADSIPADGPAQELLAHLRDCVERLLALIGMLPPAQRSAFLLKEESGLSLAQIAEVSGCGHETVKSRLRYAMQRLRAGLEGCDD